MKKYRVIIYVYDFILLVLEIFYHKEMVLLIGNYPLIALESIALLLLVVLLFKSK